jgi:hypothetical protein
VEAEEIVSQFNDLKRRLAEKGQELARIANGLRNTEGKDIAVWSISPAEVQYSVQLRRMDEIAPDLRSGEQLLDNYVQSLTGIKVKAQRRYQFPAGRKLTATDHWLISAIDKSLPKAPPGKRSKFSRDEVTRMTFEAAFGETLREKAGVRSARRRKSKP